MNDLINNRIQIEVLASGKPIKAHLLAVTRLSDKEVAKSINEVIEENGIAYDDIKPPRSEKSNEIATTTMKLIERKMNDIGIEIYIFGFLTVEEDELCCVMTKKTVMEEKNDSDVFEFLSKDEIQHFKDSLEHNKESMEGLSKL